MAPHYTGAPINVAGFCIRGDFKRDVSPPFNNKPFSVPFVGSGASWIDSRYSATDDDDLMLALCGAYFADVPAGYRRFFREPPVGYAIAFAGPMGFLMAGEWVGKLHISVVSEPFFLGSPRHEDAVARLPGAEIKPAEAIIEFPLDAHDAPMRADSSNERENPDVFLSVAPVNSRQQPLGRRFVKVIECYGRTDKWFRSLFTAYGSLREARSKDPAGVPAALVEAELLFGQAEVCVSMPWIQGREATADDFFDDDLVASIADAIHWLACRGMIYVDLRPPNVMIEDHTGKAYLIDYDDIATVKEPPTSYESFEAMVEEGLPPYHVEMYGTYLMYPTCAPVAEALKAKW